MTALQLALPMKASITQHAMVLWVMTQADSWLTAYEVVDSVRARFGVRISESGCTARLREMRSDKFGNMDMQSRPRKGSSAWEYRLAGVA